MNLDEIRELIRMVSDTGVAELEVQRGHDRVRIRLSHPLESYGMQPVPPPVFQAPIPSGPPATTSGSTPATGASNATSPAAETPKAPSDDQNLVMVKSPIVGTFYESSSPTTPPFVRVGETVKPGKVLCIIESMKLMNEIEAEVAGVIESKLVSNGKPVEYGEALFAIRTI